MNAQLIVSEQGTPLIIMEAETFLTWKEKQSGFVNNWLAQTKFSSGVSLIPDSDGQLSQAIYVADDLSHYFSCGDLAKQLPEGQYLVDCPSELQLSIAFAWLAGSYSFDRYKESTSKTVTLALTKQNIVDEANNLAQATALVRDLVNTPACDMMPENLADTAILLAEQYSATMSQIIGDDLLTENYPTIHAVGRASAHQPRLIDLKWGDEKHPKITLVGKGVCFDSGGLDLKPAAGMRLMKKDMGGSAHVLGLAQLIMASNLPVRLRVLIPAVENAVSSNAIRPGDVITTRKGISVEIDNTDAEGRLVLCDAIDEAENDNPELIVDFATLTGAMRVALGTEIAGFFSTNNDIAEQLTLAGAKINDPVWRLPLHNPYQSLLSSNVADLSNCGSTPFGGAITAALYLQAFLNKEQQTDWLHFDIMAWNTRHLPGRPVGGEAFGIRAVFEYLKNNYKK